MTMSLCGCHLRSLDEIQMLSLSNIQSIKHDLSCFYRYVHKEDNFLPVHLFAFGTNVPPLEMRALLEATTDEEFARNLKSGYNPLFFSLLHDQNTITIDCIIKRKKEFLTARTKKIGVDVYNECPLHLAVRTQKNEDIIAMVAEGFISAIFMINSKGENPLHTALESSCSAQTIELLLSVMRNFPFENMMILLLSETEKGETMLEIAIRKKYDRETIEKLSWLTVKAARESGVNVATLRYKAGEPLQDHFSYVKHSSFKDCWNLTPTSMVKRRLRSVPTNQSRDVNHFLMVIVKKTHSPLITSTIDKETSLGYDIVLQTEKETEDMFERSVKFLENKWEKRLVRACVNSYAEDTNALVWAMQTVIQKFDLSFYLDTSCLDGMTYEQKENLIHSSNANTIIGLSEESVTFLMELMKIASKSILYENMDSIQKLKDIDEKKLCVEIVQAKLMETNKKYDAAVEKAKKASEDLIAEEESEKMKANIKKKKSRRNDKQKKTIVTEAPSLEIIEYNIKSINNEIYEDASHDYCSVLSKDDIVAIEINTTNVFNDNSDQETECIVCMENKKDTCFVPCGHVCVCASCAGEFYTGFFNLFFAIKIFPDFL